MKIGILGAGSIAHSMAKTVSRMEGTELYAVASRSIGKAEDFAAAGVWGTATTARPSL